MGSRKGGSAVQRYGVFKSFPIIGGCSRKLFENAVPVNRRTRILYKIFLILYIGKYNMKKLKESSGMRGSAVQRHWILSPV